MTRRLRDRRNRRKSLGNGLGAGGPPCDNANSKNSNGNDGRFPTPAFAAATAFFSMTDSVASPQSKPRRAASKKQRQGGVSSETENKLARAARSAQRLAQLSSGSGDDSTLDMFPDDPTRATLEAMNIDVRQGTLDGFELPEVVLQAVGVLDDGASPDKLARRAPRAVKVDLPAPVSERLSGFDIEPAMPAGGDIEVAANSDARGSEPATESALTGASGEIAPALEAAADDKPTVPARDQSAPLTSAMAAATVARAVTALRQAAEAGSTGAAAAGGGKPPQRFAATLTKATTATRDVAAAASTADAGSAAPSNDEVAVQTRAASAASEAAAAFAAAKLADVKEANKPSTAASSSLGIHAPLAAPSREARRAEAAAAALRAEPELDRARATAFADTVDALYGVIADQRRAATDHTRRMKWMLSIVVGALLVTVAIGIAQTLLLMRLTRETTAQQQRIEQMMQNQQAAMVSLLDAHTSMAALAANAAPAPIAAPPAAPSQAGPTPVHGRHVARAPQGHKAKAAKASGQH